MLGRVVVENGVKKIVPLTADCGSGNPVGTVIAVYSNKVPNGYLPCNGVAFDTAQFPVLYALLQDDHTPDLRECTLVGIGTSDRTMGAHDVYTVGQFKDDQVQDHRHTLDYSTGGSATTWAVAGTATGNLGASYTDNVKVGTARTGTTTHGKQVGVNWCIKATSGINENQADNVLSALSPVNAVTDGDMHAVTSNAVASFIQRTSYGFKIGNLMVETISINIGTATFTNGRVNILNPYTFSAPFTGNPNVILCSQNDADYGYCTVLGIVRTQTKIQTLSLYRGTDGTFNNIFVKGIAIGV